MKDLVFKGALAEKIIEQYVGSYMIEEVASANAVKLKLLVSTRIHSVVNISRVVRYKEPVKRQRVEKPKPVKVDGEEE